MDERCVRLSNEVRSTFTLWNLSGQLSKPARRILECEARIGGLRVDFIINYFPLVLSFWLYNPILTMSLEISKDHLVFITIKVLCGPYMVSLDLNWTPIFEWYIERLVNRTPTRHVLRWDRMWCSKYKHRSKFNCQVLIGKVHVMTWRERDYS